MNTLAPWEVIRALWIVFAAFWLISAFRRKKTKRRENWSGRAGYVLPLVVAWMVLERPELRHTWLSTRFVPDTATIAWVGVAATAFGVFIACWARVHLGSNWSGTVTLKEGHELIRSGPYRNIRHPIYTGILLAMLGSVIAQGEIRGLMAFAISWFSFYIKARREERFLAEEFGPGFQEHARHTGMFLPRLS